MTDRVILLLPRPDILQLANCYKYIKATGESRYHEIYTMRTIFNRCNHIKKLLIIGHGEQGKVNNAKNEDVAATIIRSGISLAGDCKVTFDNCYAGATLDGVSTLTLIAGHIKHRKPAAKLCLTGYAGATVTVSSEKRLVVNDDHIYSAYVAQKSLEAEHKVILNSPPLGWKETLSSAEIQALSEREYKRISAMTGAFRDFLNTKDIDGNFIYLKNTKDMKATVNL